MLEPGAESNCKRRSSQVVLPELHKKRFSLCAMQELENLAGKVLRLMLFSQFEKPGAPVPRMKLTELMHEYRGHKEFKKLAGVSGK